MRRLVFSGGDGWLALHCLEVQMVRSQEVQALHEQPGYLGICKTTKTLWSFQEAMGSLAKCLRVRDHVARGLAEVWPTRLTGSDNFAIIWGIFDGTSPSRRYNIDGAAHLFARKH